MNAASIVSLVAVILTALGTAFSGSVSSFWAEHPDATTVILAVWAAVAHFLPAPKLPEKP